MSFHSKMIKLRKHKGFTQETFAAEIGVSRQSVYKWASGQSYPEVEKLLKVARTFGVTVDDMLNEEMEVGRNGEMMPIAEYLAEEERIKKEAEEKRARRAAAKAKREEKKAAAASADTSDALDASTAASSDTSDALDTAAAASADTSDTAKEVNEVVDTAIDKVEGSVSVVEDTAETKKKKGGFFGFFRKK